MNGTAAIAWTEFKLNLRDPLMVFWSIAFPALWMVLMVVIIGKPIPGYDSNGLNFASFVFPGAISLVILSASFIGVPLTLTTYRENGVLKRLSATPVRTSTLTLGFSLSQFAFIMVGVLVLFLVGKAFMGARIEGSLAAFLGIVLLGMVLFLALGSAIGSITGSFRSANIIIWTAFMPMLLLSDLFIPISALPGWLQPVAQAIPLTPVVTLLRDISYGHALTDLWRFGVVAGWIVLSVTLIVKFFRWE